jgi:hypothetical protein
VFSTKELIRLIVPQLDACAEGVVVGRYGYEERPLFVVRFAESDVRELPADELESMGACRVMEILPVGP